MDRIDLFVDAAPVTAADLSLPPPAEGTAEIAARVRAAREVQDARYAAAPASRRPVNADVPGPEIEAVCAADAEARELLTKAAEKMALSARGYYRVLKVARTIADLDGAAVVRRLHIAEALSYRFRSSQDDARRHATGSRLSV